MLGEFASVSGKRQHAVHIRRFLAAFRLDAGLLGAQIDEVSCEAADPPCIAGLAYAEKRVYSSYALLTRCLVILNMPAMFILSYSKSAAKALAKMPRKIAGSIQAELTKIAASPATYRGDWKPLQGSPFWRLRSGSYRVICELRDKELLILVLKIGSRGDVYK